MSNAQSSKTIVQCNGVDIAIDVVGPDSGPTVVLLHAGAESRNVWSPITPTLNAAGWRTIAPDFRGHGESGRAPQYRFDDFLDDTAILVEALAGSPIVFVGGSIGGVTGLVLLGEQRVQADGIVLLDVPTAPQPQAGHNERNKISTARKRGNPAVESVDATFLSGDFLAALLEDLQRWRRAGVNVKVPSLLVRGTRSDVVDDRALALLRTDIPHIEVRDVDAGHLVARDQPEEVAELLIEFLADIKNDSDVSGG